MFTNYNYLTCQNQIIKFNPPIFMLGGKRAVRDLIINITTKY